MLKTLTAGELATRWKLPPYSTFIRDAVFDHGLRPAFEYVGFVRPDNHARDEHGVWLRNVPDPKFAIRGIVLAATTIPKGPGIQDRDIVYVHAIFATAATLAATKTGSLQKYLSDTLDLPEPILLSIPDDERLLFTLTEIERFEQSVAFPLPQTSTEKIAIDEVVKTRELNTWHGITAALLLLLYEDAFLKKKGRVGTVEKPIFHGIADLLGQVAEKNAISREGLSISNVERKLAEAWKAKIIGN